MGARTYGQFCGLARALELVGDRWALLVVRDLVLGPKRFTDLRAGLPRIPTNVLSARLKELEAAGVIRRRALPRPAASVVYELTEYGAELEDVLMRLGRWGARSLTAPRDDEIVTPDSIVMALRATFRPEAAGDLRAGYELHLGDVVVHARIDAGVLDAGTGPLPGADLVVAAPPAALRPMLAGEVGPGDVARDDAVRVEGDPALLARFIGAFGIGPAAPVTGAAGA